MTVDCLSYLEEFIKSLIDIFDGEISVLVFIKFFKDLFEFSKLFFADNKVREERDDTGLELSQLRKSFN
jgi:hypothetical protein